jgi:hypothetical protein
MAMKTKYFLAASLLTFAVLFKFGAPVLPLVLGICLVGLWGVRKSNASKTLVRKRVRS